MVLANLRKGQLPSRTINFFAAIQWQLGARFSFLPESDLGNGLLRETVCIFPAVPFYLPQLFRPFTSTRSPEPKASVALWSSYRQARVGTPGRKLGKPISQTTPKDHA